MNAHSPSPTSAEFDPRERLLSHGVETVSTEELIAAILGNSSRQRASTRVLAARLLSQVGSPFSLASLEIPELAHDYRLGLARACRLKAALALGRRSLELPCARNLAFLRPRHVFDYFRPRMLGLRKEVFYALQLDTKHRCLREERISEGTMTASLVHPREVFRSAVRCSAYGILIVHNHPSGDPNPSQEDREVTDRLTRCGQLIGVPLIDHVIIGKSSYYSLCRQEMSGSGLRAASKNSPRRRRTSSLPFTSSDESHSS